MQRAPVFVLDDARQARAVRPLGRRSFRRDQGGGRGTTRSGKLRNIRQYPVGPLRYLRFNYTTGDAAGQNMTGKATLPPASGSSRHYPGNVRYLLSGNIDTDKKHSRINMLETRGKRVVAEATINRGPSETLMGVDTETLFWARQIQMAGSFLAGSANNGAQAANGLAAMFIATGQDAANVAESHAGIILHATARQRRLLLVGNAQPSHRRHLRRRHRAGHPDGSASRCLAATGPAT